MNSGKQLFLRPPPNVEFVQGYPGIPPGAPDRPQAAIKGMFEVRLGAQGVKAKYVRIELRKIETLPGGGTQSTFFDYVGQSPINLWQSSEEFSTLHSGDIPFYIRIPESIAPSLALEKGAGVKYELVGQVCVQGKTSFLRRSKPIVHSTSTAIIIDKHELHSTWPVYQQPESRHLTQDAVSLTVDRSQNCYGPGDRVSVMATIKSDSLHTVILRGFEFTLKETTIFRAGPHSHGVGGGNKKGAPQVKINIIGEQKVPVNKTLYGGSTHKSELSCTIPQSHTTTTLTSARHIDITYVLGVKALMGTGKPLIMELPVIVSNWPRYVSVEAVRRIGHAPNLCLSPVLSISPQPGSGPSHNRQSQIAPHTISTSRIPNSTDPVDYTSGFANRQSHTMPNGHNQIAFGTAASHAHGGGGFGSMGRADEFGFIGNGSANGGGSARPGSAGNGNGNGNGAGGQFRPGTAGSINVNARPGTTGSLGVGGSGLGQPITNDPNDYGFGNGFGSGGGGGGGGGGAGGSASGAGSASARARPRAGTLPGSQNRLTIVNAVDNEIAEEEDSPRGAGRSSSGAAGSGSGSGAGAASGQSQNRTQAGRAGGGGAGSRPWMSAEEEKARLYQQAKAEVERVQGGGAVERADTPPAPEPKQPVTPPAAKPAKPKSRWLTAEEEKIRLYNEAQKNARIMQGLESGEMPTSPPPPTSGSRSSHGRGDSKDSSKNYSSAAGSKSGATATPPAAVSAGAALYSAAMSSMPSANKSQGQGPATPPATKTVYSPIPKPAPSKLPTAEEEKEMLRRYHQAKNAVQRHHEEYGEAVDEASPATGSGGDVGPGADEMPPPWVASSQFPQQEELSEKERYRRALEAVERNAVGGGGGGSSFGGGFEMGGGGSTPPPPIDSGLPPAFSAATTGVMSAANEKEMLRQQYAAQDALAQNGNSNGSPPPPPITPPQNYSPPPLSSELPAHLRGRTQPALPVPQGASRPLTAAEEKAMLRAKFEAEERGGGAGLGMPVPEPAPAPANGIGYGLDNTNGAFAAGGSSMRSGSSGGTHHTLSTRSSDLNVPLTPALHHNHPAPAPPPLAPRPPVEYIEETKAEDAKLKRALSAHEHDIGSGLGTFGLGMGAGRNGVMLPEDEDDTFGLKIRPTSPFSLGMDDLMKGVGANIGVGPGSRSRQSSYGSPGHMNGMGSPPPLPPKVPIRDH